MKVSVIIPNYNGEKFLPIVLKSLYEDNFKEKEIIVVNNGSTDNSVSFIEKNYPDVRIVKLDKNYGFAYAINRGVEASKSQYVFLLNNDIEVEKNCIKNLYENLEKHNECYAAAVKMMFYDERNTIYNVGDLLHLWGSGGARGYGEPDKGQYNKKEYVPGVTAGAALYRKDLFLKFKMLDESFFIFAEDVDFNFRMQLAEYKAIYIPDAVVYHIGTATVGLYSDFYVYLCTRNDVFVLIKNLPCSLFIKNFFKILNQYFKTIDYFCARGQGEFLLKGKIEILLKLFEMLKKRFINLKHKKVDNEYLKKILSGL